jgi:hypothetical protein
MICAATCVVPTSAAATEMAERWQFHALIYGYFPAIHGRSDFPARTGGSEINISASDVISSVKFTFMGTIEARKGRWGAFTDVLYLDSSASKEETRNLSIGHVELPASVTANLNLDVKSIVWTLAGTYRIAAGTNGTLDLLAGARFADVKQTLDWQFSADLGPLQPSRSGSSEIKGSNWDAIVGVKGRFVFGDDGRWFVPYYFDVGAGESRFTGQAIVGLGYAFHWGDVIAGWRYLDYNFKSGSRLDSLDFSGALIGAGFHW